MRNAPSVMYPVGRSFFYALVLTALALLSLAVWLAWWEPGLTDGESSLLKVSAKARWAGVPGLILWLCWCGWAWFSWWRPPSGVLHWDAQGSLAAQETDKPSAGVWRWRGAADQDGPPLQRVSCVLDLQSLALLQLQNSDGAHRWVWVESRSDPPHWMDLRRAWVATQA